MATLKVAPYESCILCFKGDVTTGFRLRGEGEFIVAALHSILGLSPDEASETFRAAVGSDPGMVPVGTLEIAVRLCPECAAKSKDSGGQSIPVADFTSGTLPCIDQGSFMGGES